MIKTEDVIVVKTAALTFYVVILYSAGRENVTAADICCPCWKKELKQAS